MDLPQLGPVALLLLKSRKSAACPEPRPLPLSGNPLPYLTFSRGNLKPAGLANACRTCSQKLDEIVTTTALLLFKNGPRSNLRAFNFPGGASPPDPSSLVWLLAYNLYAYIHIRHPHNPPSENPGYGPAIPTCITLLEHGYCMSAHSNMVQ